MEEKYKSGLFVYDYDEEADHEILEGDVLSYRYGENDEGEMSVLVVYNANSETGSSGFNFILDNGEAYYHVSDFDMLENLNPAGDYAGNRNIFEPVLRERMRDFDDDTLLRMHELFPVEAK